MLIIIKVEISVPLNEAEASIVVTDLTHCISFFALVSFCMFVAEMFRH
jgi:hypothetical protein